MRRARALGGERVRLEWLMCGTANIKVQPNVRVRVTLIIMSGCYLVNRAEETADSGSVTREIR